jgi:DNA polymerase III subunit gamma/tau
MAPELVQLPAEAADAVAAQAVRLGPAAIVGAIERLGEILVELRHSPDPRVLIEVALVQLCRQHVSADELELLAARVAKLEHAAAAPPPTSAPVDPATGRAKLGGHAQQPASAKATPVAPAESTPPPSPAPTPAATTTPTSDEDLRAVWHDTVRPNLRGLTRALFAPVEVVAAAGDVVTLSAPNPTHQGKCEQQVADVERALRDATGRAITVRWESASSAADPTPVAPPAPSDAVDDDHHVPDESRPAFNGGPSVLERLSDAFPGATLVGEDD